MAKTKGEAGSKEVAQEFDEEGYPVSSTPAQMLPSNSPYMTPSGLRPWDQGETETPKAYAAFQIYLNLDPASRTYIAAHRLYRGEPKATQVPGYMVDWIKNHNWSHRVDLWDRYRADQQRDSEIQAIRDAAKRRVDAYNTLVTVGLTIISKADLKNLDAIAARDMLTSSVNFIDVGAKGQRMEIGEPTEHAVVDFETRQGDTTTTIAERTLESIIRRGGLFTLPDSTSED